MWWMRPAWIVASLYVAPARADAPIERRLYTDRVESSSFLWNDWNKFQENYHPLYAVDDDPATAWVEGAAGSGAGEWVRFQLTHLDGATSVRLRLRNGYQKSPTLYKANARAKEVRITLLPSGVTTTATLQDVEGWQELTVAQPAGPLQAVELRVVSVVEGGKYTDLCVSDVEIYATATTRDNPAVEKARLARVVAWKKDRLDAAAMFKSTTAAQIPIAPAYTLAADKGSPVGFDTSACASGVLCGSRVAVETLRKSPSGAAPSDATFDLAVSALSTGFVDWAPVQAVASDTRRVPAVDGLASVNLYTCFDGGPVFGDDVSGEAHGAFELPAPDRIGFLRADTVGTFAVTSPPTIASALAAKPAACAGTDAQVMAWEKAAPATASAPARLQALFLVTCGVVETREGSERVAVPQLLVYDEAGRLSLLVGARYATAFTWRADGASEVIAGARRVGFGNPAMTLTEARAVASP